MDIANKGPDTKLYLRACGSVLKISQTIMFRGIWVVKVEREGGGL